MGLENNKDVAIACFVGVVSWAVLVHWIPSFRWIPYAFVAGILVSVLGLAYLILTTSRGSHAGFNNPRTIAPPAFIRPEFWQQEKAALRARSTYVKPSIYPQSVNVSASVDGFFDLMLRDFITSWYRNVSDRTLFQNEVDRAIRGALSNIGGRMAGLDIVEIAVARIAPIITNHMRDFSSAERAVRGKHLSRDMTESDELDLAIAAKYKDGKLHPAASLAFSDTKLMQQSHLRKIVSKLLPVALSDNMKSSPAVTTLIREIIACAVLVPVMIMLSDPDFFNQQIEGFGRTLLQDRKTVRKLRAALDEHAPSTPQHTKSAQFSRLRPQDNERQFERFIRAIRHCATLSDARRFRSEIVSQIRKGTSSGEQDPIYLRRLETGRRMLDQKIAYLAAGGTSKKPKLVLKPSSGSVEQVSKLGQASLKEVLHNASGLSYFMEFMDRKNRMRLVQFWIVVDGFRNPLEEDNDEPGQELQGQSSWTAADRMDIEQIFEAYLSKPDLNVSGSGRKDVQDFLKAGKTASIQMYVTARSAVLKAQTFAFEEMKEQHFENFKKSDLFYKWLATEESSVTSGTSNTSMGLSSAFSIDGDTPPLKDSRVPPPVLPTTRFKEPDLRRPNMSSTDLKSFTRPTTPLKPSRRSIDDVKSRPLFDDDVDDERMSQSVPAIGAAESDNDGYHRGVESVEVVNAMQAALDEIMDEPEKDSLFATTPQLGADVGNNSPRSSIDSGRPSLVQQKSKPSIASLGLVGAPSALGVFADDLFEDEERFLEDEREDSEIEAKKRVEDDIHEAAPGDLGLAEAIDALNSDNERLTAQDSILDSLTKKAELTNNAAELRILKKSKQSLQREIQRKEMQKQQYVVQESDNSLYGRAAITIKSIMVGKEEDGHEYALYVIEVRRQAGDQMPAATWAVTRRYSEFHELNKRLKARFPAVRNLEFPTRQTLFTLQKDFLQKRRVVLERYLRALLLIPAICRSRELRAFLSQSAILSRGTNGTSVDERDFVTRIYNSVTDGMEEFLGNIPVLDQLSVAGQNLISAATAQMNGVPINPSGAEFANDPMSAAEAQAEIAGFEDRDAEPFVKPICDIFLEIFELQKGTSWLRGRAVVVVLHQLLGGTIERKVREAAKGFAQDDSILKYVELVKDTMWPGGQMRQAGTPRTAADKARSRKEAGLLLATLVPDMAGSVVGRVNAQAASRKIFAMLNNQRLK